MPRYAAGRWLGVLPVLVCLTDAGAYASNEGDQAIQTRRASPQMAEQRPGKAAWRWTTEERLARRFDPEAMKARVAEERAEQLAIEKRFPKINDELFTGGEDTGAVMDTLNGRKHPEVFFPDELFSRLLHDAFLQVGEDQTESRRSFEERAAALGFGRDLWPRLERVAAPVLRAEKERRRSDPGDEAKMKGEAIRVCRVRAQSLAAAKVEFGEEPFLRLLYEAVAPGIVRDVVGSGLGSEDVEGMRYTSGGCP